MRAPEASAKRSPLGLPPGLSVLPSRRHEGVKHTGVVERPSSAELPAISADSAFSSRLLRRSLPASGHFHWVAQDGVPTDSARCAPPRAVPIPRSPPRRLRRGIEEPPVKGRWPSGDGLGHSCLNQMSVCEAPVFPRALRASGRHNRVAPSSGALNLLHTFRNLRRFDRAEWVDWSQPRGHRDELGAARILF